MVKPGITTSYLVKLTPEEMAKSFAEKGWRELELSSEHSATLVERGNPSICGKDFKNLAESFGISFPQGHLWLKCDITEENQQEIIDKLKSWLDLYLTIGIKAAVLHPGGGSKIKTGLYTTEQLNSERALVLRSLSEYLHNSDLTICLENIHGSVPEIEDLQSVIKAADCNHLGICLDTGHLHLAGGKQGEFIRKAGTALKALHIQDNPGKEWGKDTHLAPYGFGRIDWEEVMTALKEVQYNGLFTLEISGEARCPMPVKMAKLGYLREIAQWMVDQINT